AGGRKKLLIPQRQARTAWQPPSSGHAPIDGGRRYCARSHTLPKTPTIEATRAALAANVAVEPALVTLPLEDESFSIDKPTILLASRRFFARTSSSTRIARLDADVVQHDDA
ncbi:MAG: hypothetical protein WCJ30_19610, partial [Deltaproteobacteria bacterium]